MSPGRGGAPVEGPGGVSPVRWAAAAVVLHLVLGLLLYEPILFSGGDNAGYMILAESLREGLGYLDLHLPDTPVHTKYPPLYPAVLAVLGWVGGLQLFKLASLAMTAGAVALTAGLGREGRPALAALAAATLMAVNPVLLDYAHWVLSEAPFVLLVTATLWLAVRTEPSGSGEGDRDGAARPGGDGPGVDRRAAAVPLLAAAAFFTRTAGLALLLAVVLAPALRRRWRRAAWAGAVTAAAAGGWALFQGAAAPERARYLTEFLMVNPYEPSAGTVGIAGLIERTARNFWSYVSTVLPASIAGFRGPAGTAASLGGLALAGAAAAGWLRRCLRGVGTPELFTFLYAGLISAWPTVWVDRRFLLPLLPLLLLYALEAARSAGRRVGRGREEPDAEGRAEASPEDAGEGTARAGTVGVVLLVLLLAAPAVVHVGRTAPERVRCLSGWRAGSPCVAPAQASFYAAARWTRENTPADAVVANRKPRIFYWIARRRGDVYPYSSEPTVVISGLEAMGADYVVVDAISGTTVRYLVPAVEAHLARFRRVHRERNPDTWVLRFRRGPESALEGRPPERGRGPEPTRARGIPAVGRGGAAR